MLDASLPCKQLGFLGAGAFASYTIAALRKGGFDGPILLSPRGRETAQDLAARFDCEIAASNQEVVERCDMVVLSVRPEQLDALLEDLTFHPEQIVISALAGVPLETLRATGKLPETIVRTMPVSCIEAGEGVVPLFPAQPKVEALARFAATPVVFEKESDFDLALMASCMNGWLYEFFDSMVGWMTDKGLPYQTARDLIVHNVRGATGYSILQQDKDLTALSRGIATKGTFTLTGLEALEANGGIDGWTKALDAMYTRLKSEA